MEDVAGHRKLQRDVESAGALNEQRVAELASKVHRSFSNRGHCFLGKIDVVYAGRGPFAPLFVLPEIAVTVPV